MSIATEHLTRMEKLRIIEQLWDELCRSPEEIESPAWHGDALEEAEQAAAKGEAGFVDWNQTKEHLRQGSA